MTTTSLALRLLDLLYPTTPTPARPTTSYSRFLVGVKAVPFIVIGEPDAETKRSADLLVPDPDDEPQSE